MGLPKKKRIYVKVLLLNFYYTLVNKQSLPSTETEKEESLYNYFVITYKNKIYGSLFLRIHSFNYTVYTLYVNNMIQKLVYIYQI